MLLEIYEMISIFTLAHPLITIYLMGSMMAAGIVYSLMSGKHLDTSHKKKTYIISVISSWFIVLAFVYGFLKGFLEVLFKNNEGGQ